MKLAKNYAEIIQIKQVNERKAWGLDRPEAMQQAPQKDDTELRSRVELLSNALLRLLSDGARVVNAPVIEHTSPPSPLRCAAPLPRG